MLIENIKKKMKEFERKLKNIIYIYKIINSIKNN